VAIVHGDARRTSLPSASRLPTTWAARPGVVRSAAAPAAPHFDTRHAICHYPGQKRLNVRPAPGRRPLTDMPLFPYR